MGWALYKKVEEVQNRFYELYGKDVFTNFNLPEEVTNAYYEINDMLITILADIEQEGYDSVEE